MPESLIAADALEIPYARIAIVLGLTLLVTLSLGLGLRRMLGLRTGLGRAKASRLLALADALPLGQGRALYVIEAAGRRLVIAAAGDRVALLADLGALVTAAPAAAPESQPETTPSEGADFERVLQATRRFAAGRGAVA